jgi:YebC/PmpR family DNA-binding regulatory protein
MSGHSKWSTIKRQKESKDAKRGQVFTKLAKSITVAVLAGGGITDPEKNFRLRLAVDKARALNVPKENIARAIAKGGGGKVGANWSEVTYEGYGPESIAVIVEAATDNKNRTTSEIKNIFERGGGSISSPGAVAFQFKKMGFISVEKTESLDEQILKLMDLEVEDVQEAIDAIEVYVKPEQLRETRNKIEQLGFKVLSEELTMEAINEVQINDLQKAEKILKFTESLEEHDDVQKVYANFNIADEILGGMSKNQ